MRLLCISSGRKEGLQHNFFIFDILKANLEIMISYQNGNVYSRNKIWQNKIFVRCHIYKCAMFEKVRKHEEIYLYARRGFLTYDKLLYSIYVWREATLNILNNISFGFFSSRIPHTFCKLYQLYVMMSIYKCNKSTKTHIYIVGLQPCPCPRTEGGGDLLL